MFPHPELHAAIAADRRRELDRRVRLIRLIRAESRRSARPDQPSGLVLLRRSRASDLADLERLAILDGRRLRGTTFLLAHVGGELVAAVPLDVVEEPLGDPFKPTADIRKLLQRHARALRSEDGAVPAAPSRLRDAA